MPRALGTFLKLRENEKLTRYHYYLQLPDHLMDEVERDPSAPQAERIAELSHSFAHDVLTLAVLASRCLWYEALTPDMSRSGDLPAVSTDLESYFLFLKAACDVLAELAVELAFEPRMRGQAPSGSFHDLTHWVRDNPARIDSRFHFLAAELEWFKELHGIRTNLAHRGYDTLVYTNRVTLSFGVGPFGRIETRILREKRGQPQGESHKISLTPLLPFIKRLTRAMLNVSEQLAVATAAYRGLGATSKTHAICGVYVPALHALDSYEPPVESPRLKIVAKCLRKCEDYSTASGFGFPDGHWWQFLVGLMGHFGTIPVYLSQFEEDSDGVLVAWKIIFGADGQRLGIVARDTVNVDETSFENSRHLLEEFVANTQLAKAVLVSRSVSNPSGVSLAVLPLVFGDQPADAAARAFERLTK
jgi:hypothetical protein